MHGEELRESTRERRRRLASYGLTLATQVGGHSRPSVLIAYAVAAIGSVVAVAFYGQLSDRFLGFIIELPLVQSAIYGPSAAGSFAPVTVYIMATFVLGLLIVRLAQEGTRINLQHVALEVPMA